MTDSGRDPSPAALAVQAELRRELARAPARRRVDLLLSRPDPAAAIQALPADELFHLVHEVGLADAPELVQLASPEQFRAFLDLDGWRGDEPEVARLLTWLRAAYPSSRAGELDEHRWSEKLEALDPEVVSLLLARSLKVHDLGDDPDPEITSDRFLRTVDGRYAVEFLADGADYVAVRRLVDDLYARDPFAAGRILSSIRWDLDSELVESAQRWRAGRLADLGFPSIEEALSWFARPARPGTAAASASPPAGPPDRPPGFWLAGFEADTLLDRAAAHLAPEARARFEGQLVAAANASMVADRVDPSDPEAVRGAVESTRALLEMGLRTMSGGDDAAATATLAGAPLKRVFQEGFGDLLRLRWRADRILAEAAAAGPVPALDSPLAEGVAALRLRRPRYYTGLDLPRADWGDPASGSAAARPFRSLAEVQRAGGALDDMEGLLALGRRLGLEGSRGAPEEGPRPTLSELYLTALAQERLGRPFAPVPLAHADLPAAARALADTTDARLVAEGAAGALLSSLARQRAGELAPVRAGEEPPPGSVTAILLRDD